MNTILKLLLPLGLLAVSGVAESTAKDDTPVTILSRSYQQITVKTKEGKTVKKWVKATKVVPGDTIRYVNVVLNASPDTLQGVRIVNPINPHLRYVAGSAKCQSKCAIRYSVDGGKHFDTPEHLFVTDKNGKKRPAKASEYNAIEWTIETLPPEHNETVEFRAILK